MGNKVLLLCSNWKMNAWRQGSTFQQAKKMNWCSQSFIKKFILTSIIFTIFPHLGPRLPHELERCPKVAMHCSTPWKWSGNLPNMPNWDGVVRKKLCCNILTWAILMENRWSSIGSFMGNLFWDKPKFHGLFVTRNHLAGQCCTASPKINKENA